jgi:hypothetical protein
VGLDDALQVRHVLRPHDQATRDHSDADEGGDRTTRHGRLF